MRRIPLGALIDLARAFIDDEKYQRHGQAAGRYPDRVQAKCAGGEGADDGAAGKRREERAVDPQCLARCAVVFDGLSTRPSRRETRTGG